ncbi:uncharacterized protein LOC126191178 [Schistocerca cancellata]|uniref:uncharacterized protein LOC126191178 n=1 Tax=Schistocerca cancellata TaxID=274614 RepID=UPI002118E9B4|nr:uncharacterized protein LOC126191178 [Schistocerca cancellata]
MPRTFGGDGVPPLTDKPGTPKIRLGKQMVMRWGAININGGYSGKKVELAEAASKMGLDVLAVSDIWVRGEKEGEVGEYKVHQAGVKAGIAQWGVGLYIRKEMEPSVVAIRYVNERLMWIDLAVSSKKIRIVSVYSHCEGTDQDKMDSFYEALSDVVVRVKDKDSVLLMGDFNARIGNRTEGYKKVMGKFGEDMEANRNGKQLLDFCASMGLQGHCPVTCVIRRALSRCTVCPALSATHLGESCPATGRSTSSYTLCRQSHVPQAGSNTHQQQLGGLTLHEVADCLAEGPFAASSPWDRKREGERERERDRDGRPAFTRAPSACRVRWLPAGVVRWRHGSRQTGPFQQRRRMRPLCLLPPLQLLLIMAGVSAQDCRPPGHWCADDYACCDGCCLSGVCEYTRAPCYIDRDDMCLSHYCPGGFECYLYQPHISVAPYPDCRPVKN